LRSSSTAKVCLPAGAWLIGSPHPRRAACFHAPRRDPTDRPLGTYVPRFILPCRAPSSEFLRPHSRSSLSGRAPLPGFPPSSRHHRCASTLAGDSTPSLRSALRFSQPLGGLLRTPASRACCIPQPRPGSFLVQGLLSPRSHPSSSEGACPLAVVPRRLTDLRRCPPALPPASRRFSARSGVPPVSLRPLPSSSSSPPGSLLFRQRSRLTQDRSALEVLRSGLDRLATTLAPPALLQRILGEKSGWLVSELPTCPRILSLASGNFGS